jgi:DNA-binding transcriptional MerR regulator
MTSLNASTRSVSIAVLVKRLGVTARALRHYQDMGLIRSHRIAHNTRAYDPEAVAIVETIVALREVDLPLTVIREILALRSDPQEQAAATCAALAEAVVEKQRQIAKIQTMLETLAASPSAPIRPRASGPMFGLRTASPGDVNAGV